MIDALRDFHFLRPWWLLGLVMVPVLWWLASRATSAQRELSRLVDPELLPHVLYGEARRHRAPSLLLACAAALCVLALAGPAWSRVASPLYANQSAQVVALSLSQRMLARDVAPTRLDRAKLKARALFEANRDGLNGLIAYAGEAFAVAPLTNDAASLRDLLDALSPDTMPTEGDNAAQAIERAAAMIHDAKAGHGEIVLITDSVDKAAIDAASKAVADGAAVSVLAVGTPQGAPIPLNDGSFMRGQQGDVRMARRDDDALRALAETGGGRFAVLSDDGADVETIHGAMRSSGMGAMATDARSDEWQDRGAWLLLPLLPIAALAFRRGWVLLAVLALLPLSMPAHADGWRDWWKRPDQQAAQALQEGRAEQAQQLAKDPAWRGVAAYRAGHYAEAAEALHQAKGADAAYNLGNALAKQQQFKEAIDAYDRALKLDPGHADALANRKAVEDWMRQHPEPPPSKQGDKNEKKGQGKDGPSSGTPNGDKDDKSGKGDDKQDKPSEQQSQASNQSQDPNGKGKDQTQPSQQGQPQASAAKPLSPKEEAEQKAQAEKAREALQKQMDEAMQQKQAHEGKPQTHELGELSSDDPQSKLPDDVRRALQRVPDDPGALLRRKFELEYRQRHGISSGDSE